MTRDLTFSAVYMGLLAAFVGYAASFAIVLAGLKAMGADDGQAATGLFFTTLGMGLCSVALPALTRAPTAVAWSTPGAAFLASTAALPGGFAETVGAFLCCAAMIVLTGFVPALGRAVSAIPRPVANALLSGVLLKLCMAPALALGHIPLLAAPVLLAWVVGLAWKRLFAMPFAVAAFLAVMAIGVTPPEGAAQASAGLLPPLSPIMPIFAWQSVISVAAPIYLVTMAGQNIPGFAVLELNGYAAHRRFLIRSTGFASLAIAPFGAIPVNMSAITAAMMSGPDAGADPARRYWAAMVSGLSYVALAFAAGPVVALASVAPSELITAVAGLALAPALAASLSGAFNDQSQIEAPALTFLITASGMTLLGVSGAFWGVAIGSAIWLAKRWRSRAQG